MAPEIEGKEANTNPEEEEPFQTNEASPKDAKERTWAQQIRYVASNITVEPIFAGLVISSTLSRLAVQNMNLDKACRVKLGFGDEICDAMIDRRHIANMSVYERDTQKVIASIEAWKSVINTAIPTILIIFMGAWSDRKGNRKICIQLPIIGEILVAVSNMLSTIFFYEIPVEATMALEAIFPAITGGWTMLYLGVFCYISDVSTPENRTFRVGLANLCLTAGIPIGTALSGILLKVLGYYGVFTISGSIYILTLCYGLWSLKSNTKPNIDKEKKDVPIKASDVVTLLKETIDVALKKRTGITRMKIVLTLFVVAIIYGPNTGESIIKYMYLRYRLNWDAVMYSIYSSYSVTAHSIGALFSISVFSRRWGFHDSALCLISVISHLVGTLSVAFVRTDFQMFMVPLIEILNATTFTSLRSMASKLVTSEEMGKMNSLFSLVETLAAFVFDPIYSGLYFATLPVLPQAVFFFSAAVSVPAASILIWFFVQHRRELRQLRSDAIEAREEVIQDETTPEKPDLSRSIEDIATC